MTRRGGSVVGDLIAHAAAPWMRRKADKLSHRNALTRLKAVGFAPRIIYDIGAYRGGWSRLAAEVFPAAAFILFEANADNAAHLQAAGHRHFIVALADADGDKTLFLPRNADVTGASLYVENSSYYAGGNLLDRRVATARLDTLTAAHGLPPADLIKIDVQGTELDVIVGGTQALDRCEALIAELSRATTRARRSSPTPCRRLRSAVSAASTSASFTAAGRGACCRPISCSRSRFCSTQSAPRRASADALRRRSARSEIPRFAAGTASGSLRRRPKAGHDAAGGRIGAHPGQPKRPKWKSPPN
jgi:FkbM family methyltransferase